MDRQLVTLRDLEAAARVLAPVAVRTPLLPADVLTDLVGGPVWIKPEMLQRGGAFKFRGAYNFLSRMDPDIRARGVIAPSSGNHAQAVALAAKLFGVPATVVMPTTVTPAKADSFGFGLSFGAPAYGYYPYPAYGYGYSPYYSSPAYSYGYPAYSYGYPYAYGGPSIGFSFRGR